MRMVVGNETGCESWAVELIRMKAGWRMERWVYEDAPCREVEGGRKYS